MRSVIFDTNVVVSAGLSETGAPGQLMLNWVLEGQIQLITCPSITREYLEVLSRPKFSDHGFPPVWLDFVLESSLQTKDPPLGVVQLPDPSDEVFLLLAKTTGAYLITGNTKHYPVNSRDGVVVMTPAEYLALLDSRAHADG
jgi:putative PIN family toxin of toxin-antitoxin system